MEKTKISQQNAKCTKNFTREGTKNFTREEKEIAKSLLRKQNAMTPKKYGGTRISPENMSATLKVFNNQTGRQLKPIAWRKLCYRIRSMERDRLASTSQDNEVISDNLFTMPREDTRVDDGNEGHVNAAMNEDMRVDEVKDSASLEETNYNLKSVMSSSSSANKSIVHDKDNTENMAQIAVGNKSMNIENYDFLHSFEDLQLQTIEIGDWILIQRATFDIHVNGEPYHSIQLYVNLKAMTYIRRVWGISERREEFQNTDDLRDLCIATFYKSKVCSGYIEPDPCRGTELVQVKYPFTRWTSRTCFIRYGKDKDSGIIGLCSACSGEDAKIKRIHIKKKTTTDDCIPELISDDILPFEHEAKQIIKCENFEYRGEIDVNCSVGSNESEKEENGSGIDEVGTEAIFDEDYDGISNVSYENGSFVEDKNENAWLNENSEACHDEENSKHINEDYWQKILRNDSQISDETQERDEECKRKQTSKRNFTEEEKEVAKSLLRKHNALKPRRCGGSKLSSQESRAARASFNARTGRQVKQIAWRKLCARLRHAEILVPKPVKKAPDEAYHETNIEKPTKSGWTERTKYTQEEREVAKSLLMKHNSMKLKSDGGSRLNSEESGAARAAFNARTGHLITQAAWKRLCHRLRKGVQAKERKRAGQGVSEELPTCDHCGISLSSMETLEYHIKAKHCSYSDREYKCDFPGCKKAYVYSSQLKYHKSSHGAWDFVCDQCGKSYFQKDHLIEHLRSKHKALSQRKIKCKYCDEVFNNYNYRLWHTNLVHFPDKYKCSICQKKYGSQSLLRKHTQVAHTDRSSSFECQVCGKTLADKKGIKDHMRLHTGDLYNCSYCPWKGHLKHMLHRHIRKHHMEEWVSEHESKEDLKCTECGELLMTERALANHIGLKHKMNRTTCV